MSHTFGVEMNSALEKGMKCAALDFGRACVLALCKHYQLDSDEAFRVLNLESATVQKVKKEKKEKKEKVAVPAFPLPWTGEVHECWCEGLRLNHGLYSQCNMERCDDSPYCKTCKKQAAVNLTGKPNYGSVGDRLACAKALEYRDGKTGKQSVTYGNVLLKLSISKERAIEEASKFGLVIPEEQFQTRVTKRGRPKTKKDASASDTESETSKKRGRGRPKKEKLVVSSCGDDMIASLVAESQNHTTTSNDDVIASLVAESQNHTTTSDDESITSTESLNASIKEKEEQVKADRKAKKELKVNRLRNELKTLSIELYGNETQISSTMKIGALEKEIAGVKAALKNKKQVTTEVIEEKEAPTPPPPPTLAPPPPALAPLSQDELIAQAIEADQSESEEEEDEVQTSSHDELIDQSESEEDGVHVKNFTHNGQKYLKSSDNILYDVTTQEAIGVYNEDTDSIDEIAELSSDEEEED